MLAHLIECRGLAGDRLIVVVLRESGGGRRSSITERFPMITRPKLRSTYCSQQGEDSETRPSKCRHATGLRTVPFGGTRPGANADIDVLLVETSGESCGVICGDMRAPLVVMSTLSDTVEAIETAGTLLVASVGYWENR